MDVQFADVILPLSLPGTFTYRIPDSLNGQINTGCRVIVPFGKKKLYSGVVYKVHNKYDGSHQVKYVQALIDRTPIVPEAHLTHWKWMSEYYLAYPGDIMQVALPSALKLESQTKISLHHDYVEDSETLNDKEFLIVEALLNQECISLEEASQIIDQLKVMPLINSLIERNIVVVSEEVRQKYKPKTTSIVKLHSDYQSEDAIQKLFDELSKRAFKQLEVLMKFVELRNRLNINSIRKQHLVKEANSNSSVLKSMITKGIFVEETLEISRLGEFKASLDASQIGLSDEQQQAFTSVVDGFKMKKPVLLNGVTGSGKTEIYIKAIQEQIDQGKQSLYLLPEIALTNQIIDRLRKYFGSKVLVYHSRFTDAERLEVWNKALEFDAREDDPFILLGPRSAMFLPLINPGLIIVDEEHDHSFKQFDPSPRYHARDSAIMLAKILDVDILLGSATPSVESFYNARKEKYHLVELTKRFGGVKMPEVLVADLKSEYKNRTVTSNFSKLLINHIETTLEEGEQVILFQNRRGFSLRVHCESCNYVPQCKHCDVSLTYHKYINRLKCHYCGYSEEVPQKCPECGGDKMHMAGYGTEKIEDQIALIFPDAKVQRMDLDTTRSKKAYQNILQAFQDREIDILVGTQMVTKGLDFDNVGLVGVLNADQMISFPDFRSFERSFQHIVQVSGRSGRKKRGKVIIQTFDPYHDVIRYAIDHDYMKMYKAVASERRTYYYPPFCRMVRVVFKSTDTEKLKKAAFALSQRLRDRFDKQVLGPEYPVVSRIKNQYILQILVKLQPGQNLSADKRYIYNEMEDARRRRENSKVRIFADVDPY